MGNTRSIPQPSFLKSENTAFNMEQLLRHDTFQGYWDLKSVRAQSSPCIKKAYLRRRPRSDDGEGITALPTKKRGRKLLLGDLDMKVHLYLNKGRQSGGAVSTRIPIATASGMIISQMQSLLACSEQRANGFKKKSKSKSSLPDFAEKKWEFL